MDRVKDRIGVVVNRLGGVAETLALGLELLSSQVRAGRRGDLLFAPEMTILRERTATRLLDWPARAHSTVVCRRAMNLAIEAARSNGIGCVVARTIVGSFGPHLAPIGIGIPAGQRPAFLLDTCLTQTSSSGVKLAAAAGDPIAPGLILDAAGQPSTDPRDYAPTEAPGHTTQSRPTGSLLPLGGSHKAFGLITAVGLLTTVLAGALATLGGHRPRLREADHGRGPVRLAVHRARRRGLHSAPGRTRPRRRIP